MSEHLLVGGGGRGGGVGVPRLGGVREFRGARGLLGRGPAGSRSTIIDPLTVSAFTKDPEPSTTVRSPETELNRRSPVTACASTPPDTVLVRTGPVTPTSVVSPVTPFTSVGPSVPETTAPAPTTPTATRLSA